MASWDPRVGSIPRVERRGERIELHFADSPVLAFEGETVAAALVAAGHVAFRKTARGRSPRGVFCGIGTCFDCLVTVNGMPNQRACVVPAAAGMRVWPQDGWQLLSE